MLAKRPLGQTDIRISPVAMGCWPIAGMTSLGVNDADSLRTLDAALDAGVNFFDTAYCYGAAGESERLVSKSHGGRRDQIVIATKCGVHWNSGGEKEFDATPATLVQECDESLARLGTEFVDLLYLHHPDPNIPIAESAGAFKRLLDQGKTRAVGVSNASVSELSSFHSECPISAVQPPYNMLQRQIEQDVLPWCEAHGASAIIYWPLMKGLLAGHIARDHQFAEGDSRANYPIFQGEQFQRSQDFVDVLRAIAEENDCSVATLVVHWTIRQPSITAALCGAKRDYQIRESAEAMVLDISDAVIEEIDNALREHSSL